MDLIMKIMPGTFLGSIAHISQLPGSESNCPPQARKHGVEPLISDNYSLPSIPNICTYVSCWVGNDGNPNRQTLNELRRESRI